MHSCVRAGRAHSARRHVHSCVYHTRVGTKLWLTQLCTNQWSNSEKVVLQTKPGVASDRSSLAVPLSLVLSVFSVSRQSSRRFKHRLVPQSPLLTSRVIHRFFLLTRFHSRPSPHPGTFNLRMSAGHESASAAGLTVVDANEGVTLQATLPLTLPPPSVGSSFPGLGQYPPPGPAPPYAERDPGAVNSGSMTPPPPYAESKLGFTIGDSKTLIDYTSLRDHRPRNTRATEEPSSLKVGGKIFLCPMMIYSQCCG